MSRSFALRADSGTTGGTERSARFVVVGGVNTLVGLGVYPLLLWALRPAGVGYMGVLPISQAVCLVFAYATQKLFVFGTRGNIAREFVRFASYYLGIYALNWAALPFLVEIVGIRPIVAQLGFTILTVIGSYIFHSRLTFRGGTA
jgi:putative flippase GtrA